MKRREFSVGLGSLGALGVLTVAPAAQAQGGPVEGQHYKRLAQAVPVSTPDKIEVVEFFSYACPHCNALEPLVEPWSKRLAADVKFRRVPVFFQRPQWEFLQSLYFAVEATNQLDTLHRKVFAAMHVEHKNIARDADVLALAAANGADGAKLVDAMKSFGVQTKVRQAKQLADAYRVDAVPMLGIQGRWTTGAEAGSHERTLLVADYLIAQARKLG
ncbi:MAG: thiol:disulfide interchange protein DsbA/DsbL [Vitreoscilla sp.]|nr:thiol:disulfide interchange protein DsbA/DsbL [Vitreoscilla sp.]MBP6675304.1 thiol:disulfide interchange protein DsbA/DsbL [Vitreoscilla sp.]